MQAYQPYTRTRTHTHTRTHPHTRTRTHGHTDTPAHTLSHTHTHPHTRTHSAQLTARIPVPLRQILIERFPVFEEVAGPRLLPDSLLLLGSHQSGHCTSKKNMRCPLSRSLFLFRRQLLTSGSGRLHLHLHLFRSLSHFSRKGRKEKEGRKERESNIQKNIKNISIFVKNSENAKKYPITLCDI